MKLVAAVSALALAAAPVAAQGLGGPGEDPTAVSIPHNQSLPSAGRVLATSQTGDATIPDLSDGPPVALITGVVVLTAIGAGALALSNSGGGGSTPNTR